MSKFKITRYELSDRLELFYARADGCSFDLHIDPSDLADLASAAQAALAEQSSGVMGEDAEPCRKCRNRGWFVQDVYDDANRFMGSFRHAGCDLCGRNPNQAQRREACQP